MGRAGRKRRLVKREPNGRPSRTERKEKDVRDVAKDARIRHGVKPAHALGQNAATIVGRLFDEGKITLDQLRAAELMRSIYTIYQRAIDVPPGPKAVAIGQPSRGEPSGMTLEQVERAKARWEFVRDLLIGEDIRARGTAAVYAATYAIVIAHGDHPDERQAALDHLVPDLRLGLDAIARAYGWLERAA